MWGVARQLRTCVGRWVEVHPHTASGERLTDVNRAPGKCLCDVTWRCAAQRAGGGGLRGLAEGQRQTNPARQAEQASSNIFSLVPAVCVILNPGTKGTHYPVHKKIMIIQPLKCCESLFMFPPVALFMFI